MSLKLIVRQTLTIFLFWLLFFAAWRPVFWLWQPALRPFSGTDFLENAFHGLYMDLSMAGYFSMLPLLMLSFSFLLSGRIIQRAIMVYHLLLLPVLSLMAVADLEIFQKWGHRLDAAVLPYLAFPAEALASSLSSPLHLLVPLHLFFSAAAFFLWKKLAAGLVSEGKEKALLLFPRLFFTAACILPIRGGLQLAPMNQSSVYYSPARILNQSAENPVWVFCQSLLENTSRELKSTYAGADRSKARQLCDSLFADGVSPEMVLHTGRPNVILIIWESLSYKVAGAWGGKFPSTPCLDSLARTGLQFENIYANGDRSDKGLVSILSAQPAFGKISLMSHPGISSGLDFISRHTRKLGYSDLYMYGGELEFANMKSYLLNAGFNRLIGKSDFPRESWNSKWGAHDEALFDRQLLEAKKSRQPFFHTLFTLSSHEPFEVPGQANLPGTPPDSLFCRAHRYTDRSLRTWVSNASRQAWWKNSLVIIIADHGHAQPGNSAEEDPEKFKIPMLWFGPALKKSGRIQRTGNQTDLFATLCRQLGDNSQMPAFSKNLLSPGSRDFAFYAFRNGCAFKEGNGLQMSFDGTGPVNAAYLLRQQAFESIFH